MISARVAGFPGRASPSGRAAPLRYNASAAGCVPVSVRADHLHRLSFSQFRQELAGRLALNIVLLVFSVIIIIAAVYLSPAAVLDRSPFGVELFSSI